MRPRLFCCCVGILLASGVMAQNYPERPIRLIVSFPPGGSTDVTARILSPKLSELLGKQVVVDNRPGAASTLGTELVAKAAPDGYTLLMSDTTFGIVPALYEKLPYDAERDLAAVSQVISVPAVLVVHPALPVHSVKELVALARAKPGQLNFGSGGVGTPVHMAGELLKLAARIDIVHIPYKGAGPALSDLLGGHFQMMFPTLPSVIPYIRSGKLRALAVTSGRRSAAFPTLPTMAEAGVPGVTSVAWFGVHAPAATPKAIIERLHADIVKALQDPTVRTRYASEGSDIIASAPGEFARFVSGEIAQWKKVVKQAGIKAEF